MAMDGAGFVETPSVGSMRSSKGKAGQDREMRGRKTTRY
jgi:hypothetical protein